MRNRPNPVSPDGPRILVLVFTILVLAGIGPARGQSERMPAHEPDVVLVRFSTLLPETEVRGRIGEHRVVEVRRLQLRSQPDSPVNRLYRLKLGGGWTVQEALVQLAEWPDVELVQPNYVYRKGGGSIPNDPGFSEQWGLHNTGQPGLKGPLAPTPDADIDWPEAWDALNETLPVVIVVAVIDTGIDYNHPDLVGNLWVNPGEIPGNGEDDDSNGYVDDIHGIDLVNDDSDPLDEDGHGTRVSGTIAATAGNRTDIAGVNPMVQLMALKFLDGNGNGYTSDAIECISYAIDNGAVVTNNSWAGGPFEQALFSAISSANAAGVLFVTGASNEGTDNDVEPLYPGNYNLPNVVSVAAHNRWETMAGFSNWGRTQVDLSAPGEEILSITASSYEYFDGTSMATPHVSAAAAVAYALYPFETPAGIRQRLLESTDPRPAYHERMVSHGRLNLDHLVTAALGLDTIAPAAPSDLTVVRAGADSVTLRVTATGDDGTDGRANRYDLRLAPSASWIDFDNAASATGIWQVGPAGGLDYLTATGLQPATPYTVQLRVMDDGGNSALSNTVTIGTAAPSPPLFVEDFESGSPGWTTTSNMQQSWTPVVSDSNSPVTSWRSTPFGNYPDNYQASLVSPVIDLTSVSGAMLVFWHHWAFEDSVDFGLVEVSAGGGPWQGLSQYTGTNPAWEPVELDLQPFVGAPIQIRFRVMTNPAITQEGWYIDDVAIFGVPPTQLLREYTFESLTDWSVNPRGNWGLEGGTLSDSPNANYGVGSYDVVTLTNALDLSGAERVFLSFDLDHDTELDHDFLLLQVSAGGDYWRELGRWTGNQAWHPESFDLSEYAGFPQLALRFALISDYAIAEAGSRVDNLRLEVIPAPDGDSDGVSNLQDCAPDDGSAFAVPREITNVSLLSDRVTILWASDAANSGSGTRYDVLRGHLGELPVGSGAGETCLEPDSVDTLALDPDVLAPGQGRSYLVRGDNACGPGSYGVDSSSAQRSSASCP